MASGAASAAVQIPVGMCLLGGILLTLFGTRLLKPLYVLIFAAAIGTLCSLLAPNFISDRVAGVPSPVIGVGVGAMLGSLLAVLTFRFALSLTTAATLGVVAFLGAAVYLSLMPAAQGGMGLDLCEAFWSCHSKRSNRIQFFDQPVPLIFFAKSVRFPGSLPVPPPACQRRASPDRVRLFRLSRLCDTRAGGSYADSHHAHFNAHCGHESVSRLAPTCAE
mgnify:CR=1 FL=1